MTSQRPSRPAPASGMQLAAVATAAIPVVMLSSLALAHPAEAATAPTGPRILPSAVTHGGLAAAVRASPKAAGIPTSVVAGSIPSRIAAQSPVAKTYRVAPGDTISAIAARHGLSTSAVLALNRLSATSIIYPGQQIKLAGGSAAAAPAPSAKASAVTSRATATYVVKSGDTIGAIAARHGLSTASVLAANGMNNATIIFPGQVIKLGRSAAAPAPRPAAAKAATPTATKAPSGSSYVVKAGDTLSGIAGRHGLSTASVMAANGMNNATIIYPGQVIRLGKSAAGPASAPAKPAAAKPAAAKTASGGTYVIRAGDTLSGIASRHGVGLQALASANRISVNGTIYAGKTLTIPGLSAASSSVTPIKPAAPSVPNTFLHYTYPDAVVADANKNLRALLAAPAPTRAQMKEMVARTAASMGVDPSLAMAFAQQESGFNHQVVSPANAIGTMQVIPDAGDWASGMVGRKLNLLNPQDNVTAGVAIIRALLKDAKTVDLAIAGYYQGQYSVSVHGMFPDTKKYVASVKANQKLFR
ncbi:LysM peptidoglycan-binding domain-containing protein [Arthrobacter dokdonensis]|uniref:LysM peptidoglycan-binding domain-containing protein n=1 Tax=Arthrobacter dokdonellae TaxID=2211210 RepID=UPI000DE5BD23|nr:LysM peptidoglycan-binding domain-containing protein [Arthrobacter dokdonellae]